MCHTRLYQTWADMKQRCYNHNNNAYRYYGAKGVIVCEEWKNSFEVFKNWAFKNGYSDDRVIDKDIKCDALGIEIKIYSPKTCMFIENMENVMYSYAQLDRDYKGRFIKS